MIEPEMAFYELDDDMDLAEEFLKYLVSYTLEHTSDDLQFLNNMYDKTLLDTLTFVLENRFARITYTEAIELLQKSGKKFDYPADWGADLQTEHERFLVEQEFKKPVIVVDYPKEIKAFYMKQNSDNKTVRAMDVLFPRIGEIIGGSQREENYTKLSKRIGEMGLDESDFWWYLDTRKFGTAPHSGFGLGFERLVQFVTGMANIRDVIPFPRTPKSAEF
jgi:asparaginyl-tRNA synthetase